MRRILAIFCLVAFTLGLVAQPPATPAVTDQAWPRQINRSFAGGQRPSRAQVVLYKNGVGYFEHAGTVLGNQRVAIDFTSPQLNDVLQSLTVLDDGGGRIGGVNYNSTTPLAEQLKSLSLGMTDDPSSTELFQALRGQRVEVTEVQVASSPAACSPLRRALRRSPGAISAPRSTSSISPWLPRPVR